MNWFKRFFTKQTIPTRYYIKRQKNSFLVVYINEDREIPQERIDYLMKVIEDCLNGKKAFFLTNIKLNFEYVQK